MWNRRKDDEIAPPRPVVPTPAPAEFKKELTPLSTPPIRMPEPYNDLTRGTASLGKSVLVKGQILSREDLTIDGEVEGTVELQDSRLTVGPNGKVTANIKAREVVVLGTVNGNLDVSDKIDIRKEARVVGDIKSARVVIEDGAYFKGSVDIIKVEPPRAPKQQPAPPPPAPPVAQAAVAPTGPNDHKR